jgi:3-methyladenine DNA glycosylase/8-oxoguanine DNA glycosylase
MESDLPHLNRMFTSPKVRRPVAGHAQGRFLHGRVDGSAGGTARASLGGMNAAQALQCAQAWQPWRGYATMRLWHALSHPTQPSPS